MTEPTQQPVAEQLAGELLAREVHPLIGLLGTDLLDMLGPRVEGRAGLLAAQLCDEADEPAARMTASDVMWVLWREADPPAQWWRTPLGTQCARLCGDEDSEAVTYQQAATMLNVNPGTVKRYVHDGRLDRHPDGGVLKSSVLRRIAAARHA